MEYKRLEPGELPRRATIQAVLGEQTGNSVNDDCRLVKNKDGVERRRTVVESGASASHEVPQRATVEFHNV